MGDSWEDVFSVKKSLLSPQILRHIDNLSLLHKSKEEAQIDQLQLLAKYGEEGRVTSSNQPFDEYFEMLGVDDDQEEMDSDMTRSLALVQSSLEGSLESLDEYVQEAMDANFDNGYFQDSIAIPSSPDVPNFDFLTPSHRIPFDILDPKAIQKLLREVQLLDENVLQELPRMNVEPDVFLTNSDINTVIDEFSLNPEQTRAFRIICNHALGHYLPQDPQLLMGVFGAGGTGKSMLIEALQVWFRHNSRDMELIVTATTGSVTIKIGGTTIHTTVFIPIEMADGKRV